MQGRLFGRSLLLQSAWSFERMQSLGFAFCLEPWLERCWHGRAGELSAARLRHQEFFNTQPYLASLVVGMVCALEEEAAGAAAAELPAKVARLKALKTAAASALAGMGDAWFWGALRPFCAVLAAAGAWALWERPRWAAAWAILAYLAAHNGPALLVRWGFLRRGYAWGDQIAARLKAWPGQRGVKAVRLAGLALAVACAVLLLNDVPADRKLPGALALAAAMGLRALRVSAFKVYAAVLLGGLAAGLTGWL